MQLFLSLWAIVLTFVHPLLFIARALVLTAGGRRYPLTGGSFPSAENCHTFPYCGEYLFFLQLLSAANGFILLLLLWPERRITLSLIGYSASVVLSLYLALFDSYRYIMFLALQAVPLIVLVVYTSKKRQLDSNTL